jgi:hypothetical protein
MNSFVQGASIDASPSNFINDSNAMNKYFNAKNVLQDRCSIVLADWKAFDSEADLFKLEQYCKSASKDTSNTSVPLVIINSYGYIGYIRLVVDEHCVFESHFTDDRKDLMLHPKRYVFILKFMLFCICCELYCTTIVPAF